MLSDAAKFAGLCEGSAPALVKQEAALACNLPRDEKTFVAMSILGAGGYQLAVAPGFKATRRILEAGRYISARRDVRQGP
jgi:hypothetical protein